MAFEPLSAIHVVLLCFPTCLKKWLLGLLLVKGKCYMIIILTRFYFLHEDWSWVLKKNNLKIAFHSAVPEIWNTLEIQKNENLLRSPKFYGENEFPVEMCISQLITEILSFSCFHKNFMTNLSFKIAIQLSWVQHFWRYAWIQLTP